MEFTLLKLLILMFGLSFLTSASPVCDVRAYGAKGDGVTLDTGAVVNAIAACTAQGGGTVYFAPGHYVIGTVQLYSHIRLELGSGSFLVASHDLHDYLPSRPFGFGRHYGVDITGEGSVLGMLVAKDAEDVSIDGEGEINGQGDSFMGLTVPHVGNDYDPQSVRNPERYTAAMSSLDFGPVEPDHRPGTMIVFFHCSNVRLRGVTLRSSPNWTLHLQDVEGAVISGIQILNNPKVPNNDGIDCMKCRHVRISDCDIQTGDDGFAIVDSEHVNVSNCSISSRSAAIRLESTRLSTFTGLSMDTNRGIAVFANIYPNQAVHATEDVTFSDIVVRTRLIPGQWWGKAEPIYIAVQPCSSPDGCPVLIHNVVFHDITAEAENGILFWGTAGSQISGISMDFLHLHMLAPDPAIATAVGGNLDLRWTALTPRTAIMKSEIPAIYAKQIKGLSLRDVEVDWANSIPDYFSESIRVEDFSDLSIDRFTGRQAGSEKGAAISLKGGSGVAITNSRATEGTNIFLDLNKVTGRRVFANYDLRDAVEIIHPPTLRFDTQIGPSPAAIGTVKRKGTSPTAPR